MNSMHSLTGIVIGKGVGSINPGEEIRISKDFDFGCIPIPLFPVSVKWDVFDTTKSNYSEIIKQSDPTKQSGFGEWDYVLEKGCPVHHRLQPLIKFIAFSYQLLKPGGVLIVKLMKTIIQEVYPSKILRNRLGKPTNLSQVLEEYKKGYLPLVSPILNTIKVTSNFSNLEIYGEYGLFTK